MYGYPTLWKTWHASPGTSQPLEIQLAVEHLVDRLDAIVEETIDLEGPRQEEERC